MTEEIKNQIDNYVEEGIDNNIKHIPTNHLLKKNYKKLSKFVGKHVSALADKASEALDKQIDKIETISLRDILLLCLLVATVILLIAFTIYFINKKYKQRAQLARAQNIRELRMKWWRKHNWWRQKNNDPKAIKNNNELIEMSENGMASAVCLNSSLNGNGMATANDFKPNFIVENEMNESLITSDEDNSRSKNTQVVLNLGKKNHILYQCEQCPYKNMSESLFNTHKKGHILNKKYIKCRYCTFNARHKGHLTNHELIHPEYTKRSG